MDGVGCLRRLVLVACGLGTGLVGLACGTDAVGGAAGGGATESADAGGASASLADAGDAAAAPHPRLNEDGVRLCDLDRKSVV